MQIQPQPLALTIVCLIFAGCNKSSKSRYCQTNASISSNTPRKKRMRQTINRKNQQIHRLRKRINTKKQCKSASQKDALQILKSFLPVHTVKFIESQIHLHSKRSQHGHRYTSEMKAFALTVYHLSGKAYRMISKIFCMPSKSALLKWASRLPNRPGVTQTALDAIATKVKTMDARARLCVISFDEMSLKSNVFYQSNTDELLWLEDFGDGEKTNCLATSALVFLARGIVENWKQPLAYYLVNESCGSEKVQEKLKDIISKVQGIGLEVVAVVSDLGSNFQKLLREMEITPEKPWFIFNGKKIFYLYDPPHIIKAIRNNLLNYDFHFDGKIGSWRDIQQLYNIDSKNDIRCCAKQTSKHLNPNGFQKMKVKFATQVFSHTVSAASH